MKKTLCIVLAVMLLCATFVGCSQTTSSSSASGNSSQGDFSKESSKQEDTSSEGITLNYLATYETQNEQAMKEFIARYESETGNKINLEMYPYEEYMEILEVRLGSNSNNVDIFEVDNPMTAAYTYRNYLLPLDDYFTDEEKAQFVDSALDGATINGKLMAPAIDNSSCALFYNKELLEMAGISPLSQDPKDRLTWESIVEMAQQVMKAAEDNGMNGIWGFEFDQINSPYELLPLVESLGGKAIGDDGLTVKGVLDTPEWVEAAKFYGDIHNTYNIAPKGVNRYEIWQLFQSGKLAFMVAGSYYYAQLEGSDVDWGIAPMPYFEGGKAITPTGSMHLAVASTTNHPEEAANVVKLMTLGYGNDIYMPIKKSLPARKTLAEGIMTDPEYEEFPANSYRLFSYEIQNTSVPRPSTVAYTEYESAFNTTFEDIRNGLNAEECLDNMVSQLDSIIQKYR